MLTAQQKTMRRFWYATMPISHLAEGPKPFRLMNEDIVLFLDADGEPAALRDRCCHRTAKLSKGWMDDGKLVCGYHGWTYDRDGKVVRIPQYDPGPTCRATASNRSTARRGMAMCGWRWSDPLLPLFDIPEDGAPGFRRIFQFYDQWHTAPLRLMENSFDNAHFAFVHRGTFGDNAQPKPSKYEIEETDYGFVATTVVDIVNPPAAFRVTGTTEPTTTRTMRNHWYMPFCRRMDMTYPSGIRHIIINCATPIDDVPHPVGATAVSQRHRGAVPDPGADRLGRHGGLRGPRHPGSHRSGRRARSGAPDRGAHDLRPPGPDHAPPAAGVAESSTTTRR